jgi:hypothetical protein
MLPILHLNGFAILTKYFSFATWSIWSVTQGCFPQHCTFANLKCPFVRLPGSKRVVKSFSKRDRGIIPHLLVHANHVIEVLYQVISQRF